MYGPSESFYAAKVIERKFRVGTHDGNFWTYLVDWEWENWQTQWIDEAKIADPISQRRHSPPDCFQPGT
eukprot:10185899-Ditylum_brightwellii.AAC.1